MLEYFIYLLYFIVGACFGSFSNVVAIRYPLGMKLTNPPSTCFACRKQIKPIDNIPILSFIFLRGKCRYCGHKIYFRDFLIELISAVLYLVVGIVFYSKSILLSVLLCFTISILLIIACIDYDFMFIPQVFLNILCVIAPFVSFVSPFGSVYDHMIGLLVGGGLLLLIYGVGYLIKKREVVGLGDVQLMAVMGLLIGWKAILFAYFVSFVVGCIVLLIRLCIKKEKRKNREIPFAPFLVIGLISSIFFGNIVMDLYFSLFII